jgi:hypothetical protein
MEQITMRVIALLSSMILSLLLFPSASLAGGKGIKVDARIALAAYQATAEEHLNGILRGLKIIATGTDATSGDWERIKSPLARFGEVVPTSAAMWFAKSDGSYFTVEKGPTGQSLQDRVYFPRLMEGKDVIGTLVVSKSTGERSIIVATPVKNGSKIIGAVGVSVSAKALANLINEEIEFPKDVVFYALDAEGRIALHKESSLIFEFPSDIGDQSLKSAVQKMLSEPNGFVSYIFRGAHRKMDFRKSKMMDWIFVLGTSS